MLVTADSRAVLRDALDRCLKGQQPGDIGTVLPCPKGLDQTEKSAWLELANWSADAPFRSQIAAYSHYSRNRLAHLVHALG